MTSTCVVAVSRGDFVVKVHPATVQRASLQSDQQGTAHQPAHQPRRARRGGGEPESRSLSARRLRSANRAKAHAARRRSSRLHLQQLLHRHVWRVRGWQRMQDVWTEWSRETALPLPTPAPPQPRPLPIIDPAAFPALPSAPAQAASAGLARRKREVAASPPTPPKTALLSLEQPPSPWTEVKKPRKLVGFYYHVAPPLPRQPPHPTTLIEMDDVIPGRPHGLDLVGFASMEITLKIVLPLRRPKAQCFLPDAPPHAVQPRANPNLNFMLIAR